MLPNINRCFLVERSERLRKTQEAKISSRYGSVNLNWLSTIDEFFSEGKAQQLPTICLANEFFDALPTILFHRYKTDEPWREVLIDAAYLDNKLRFFFVKSFNETANSALYRNLLMHRQGVGYTEITPEARRIVELLTRHIAKVGGLYLIVDYGYLERAGFLNRPSLRVHHIKNDTVKLFRQLDHIESSIRPWKALGMLT